MSPSRVTAGLWAARGRGPKDEEGMGETVERATHMRTLKISAFLLILSLPADSRPLSCDLWSGQCLQKLDMGSVPPSRITSSWGDPEPWAPLTRKQSGRSPPSLASLPTVEDASVLEGDASPVPSLAGLQSHARQGREVATKEGREDHRRESPGRPGDPWLDAVQESGCDDRHQDAVQKPGCDDRQEEAFQFSNPMGERNAKASGRRPRCFSVFLPLRYSIWVSGSRPVTLPNLYTSGPGRQSPDPGGYAAWVAKPHASRVIANHAPSGAISRAVQACDPWRRCFAHGGSREGWGRAPNLTRETRPAIGCHFGGCIRP
jgi:hypothetical protein